LLGFGRVLEIFQTDPVTAWERILPLVFSDVEQYSTPNHESDTRRVAMHGAIRAWRRGIVVHAIFPVHMREGVEMGAGMVMHEGITGSALVPRGVELPRLRNAIVAVPLLHDLYTEADRGDKAGHIIVHVLAQRIHFPLFDQPRGFDDHLRSDGIEHAPLIFFTPAPPVATRAPLAFDGPGGRFLR